MKIIIWFSLMYTVLCMDQKPFYMSELYAVDGWPFIYTHTYLYTYYICSIYIYL